MIRGDSTTKSIIRKSIKNTLRFIVDKSWDKVERVIRRREENGDWRRSKTQELKDFVHDCIGGYGSEFDGPTADYLEKVADAFILIADSDDAYWKILTRFVARLNKGEFSVREDEKYLVRGKTEDQRSVYRQRHPDCEGDFYLEME